MARADETRQDVMFTTVSVRKSRISVNASELNWNITQLKRNIWSKFTYGDHNISYLFIKFRVCVWLQDCHLKAFVVALPKGGLPPAS